jgi:polyferredoxin
MRIQAKRLISQLFIFLGANLGALGIKTGLCYPFFYCNACPTADAVCPLRALEISVFKGNFSWKLLLYPLLILGLLGVTSGRSICGWGCPIGFLQRGAGRIARRFKFPKIDRYLRYLKYINLLFLVIIIPYFVGFMFTDICPVGILTGTIPILFMDQKFVPTFFFYPGIAIFILFFILIFRVERGWCRYFCPVGAILAPFNKISKLHISIDEKKCTHCNLCKDACPMGIDVKSMERSPECILCGKCIEICPKQIIEVKT